MAYTGKQFQHTSHGLCEWIAPSTNWACFRVIADGALKGAVFFCGFDTQAKYMGEVVDEVDTVKKGRGKKS